MAATLVPKCILQNNFRCSFEVELGVRLVFAMLVRHFDRSFTNFNEPALAVITAAVKRRNFDTVSLPGGARASKKFG